MAERKVKELAVIWKTKTRKDGGSREDKISK